MSYKSSIIRPNNCAGLGNIYVDEVLFLSKIHQIEEVINIFRRS